jgi:hypothetical protein
MEAEQRLEVMQKLQTARRLIDDALGSLHVIPDAGTVDVSCVDFSVGKLTRCRDVVTNAMSNLNPR